MAEILIFRVVEELLWLLEKNRWDLGASSTSRSTSTALLSTRNPDSLPAKLPEEPSSGSSN